MSYTKINLEQVEDQAPGFGIESQTARFARKDLGAEHIGMAHYEIKPNGAFTFGHRHKTMEEMYVVVSGGGRFRVDDDVLDVAPRDVVYVSPESWRIWEAGPDGMELLVFGAHAEGDDESEMDPEFKL